MRDIVRGATEAEVMPLLSTTLLRLAERDSPADMMEAVARHIIRPELNGLTSPLAVHDILHSHMVRPIHTHPNHKSTTSACQPSKSYKNFNFRHKTAETGRRMGRCLHSNWDRQFLTPQLKLSFNKISSEGISVSDAVKTVPNSTERKKDL